MRPTTDRMREALMNILDPQLDWPETQLLDLFAGSGILAMECASRGVAHILSIEKNPALVRHLERLQTHYRLPEWTILQQDVRKWAQQPAGNAWGLITLDPPYALQHKDLLVERLLENHLEPKGLLVLEHSSAEDFSHLAGFVRSRNYGDSAFSFFGQNPRLQLETQGDS